MCSRSRSPQRPISCSSGGRGVPETSEAELVWLASEMAQSDSQTRENARQGSKVVPRRIRSRHKRGLAPFSAADKAPIYLRDNQFIMEYYRVDFDLRDTWRSLFRIHNETGNIWSHLVGDCHWGAAQACCRLLLRSLMSEVETTVVPQVFSSLPG